ncbi:hypothetical protein JOF34_000447 [Microbacterium amylolyticum]|uniref:Uncharacterized protein n=1 Tax=Microbacterium amylolyticum TaxID=936337 RepID=A0ABS4ZF00_9MICO|nr:hypothetical protein [Microbacterium amylolyticum]MBP2435861.1 hypothetical protein [Microbacterium amylolyticum]
MCLDGAADELFLTSGAFGLRVGRRKRREICWAVPVDHSAHAGLVVEAGKRRQVTASGFAPEDDTGRVDSLCRALVLDPAQRRTDIVELCRKDRFARQAIVDSGDRESCARETPEALSRRNAGGEYTPASDPPAASAWPRSLVFSSSVGTTLSPIVNTSASTKRTTKDS